MNSWAHNGGGGADVGLVVVVMITGVDPSGSVVDGVDGPVTRRRLESGVAIFVTISHFCLANLALVSIRCGLPSLDRMTLPPTLPCIRTHLSPQFHPLPSGGGPLNIAYSDTPAPTCPVPTAPTKICDFAGPRARTKRPQLRGRCSPPSPQGRARPPAPAGRPAPLV